MHNSIAVKHPRQAGRKAAVVAGHLARGAARAGLQLLRYRVQHVVQAAAATGAHEHRKSHENDRSPSRATSSRRGHAAVTVPSLAKPDSHQTRAHGDQGRGPPARSLVGQQHSSTKRKLTEAVRRGKNKKVVSNADQTTFSSACCSYRRPAPGSGVQPGSARATILAAPPQRGMSRVRSVGLVRRSRRALCPRAAGPRAQKAPG